MRSNIKELWKAPATTQKKKTASNSTHVINRLEMSELGPWGDITELAKRRSEPVNPTFLVILAGEWGFRSMFDSCEVGSN